MECSGTAHVTGGSCWISLDCSVKTAEEKIWRRSHSAKESLEYIEIYCISHANSMAYLWAKTLGVVSKGDFAVSICS